MLSEHVYHQSIALFSLIIPIKSFRQCVEHQRKQSAEDDKH